MPAPSPKTWLATGAHFCGSCLGTLACWALWIALGAGIVGSTYIIVARELPVPGFVLRRIEADLAQANLFVRFGRARFDPTGKILFENVALRLKQFDEPLVTSRLVFVRRNFWSALAGHPLPDEIRIEGATLQLPAMLSPSGTAEPLVRDFSLRLHREQHLWVVDLCTGRIGQLAVTAHGTLALPAGPAGSVPPTPDAIINRFLQTSRALALNIHRLDAFDEPSLDLTLASLPGGGNTAGLVFTARGVHQPWDRPLVLGSVFASGTVRLDGTGPRPLRLHAAIHHASYQGDFTAENLRAVFTAQLQPGKFALQPLGLQVAAAQLTAVGQQAVGPVVQADLTAWPDLRVETAASIDGEYLALAANVRTAEKSAVIRGHGRVAAGFIGSVLREHTPRAAPFFVFGDPVAFTAEATLGPGWKFERLSGRADAGRLDSRGVQITAARGRIRIEGADFLADDARVELGDNFATGSYRMNFHTTDYRMLLRGQLRPAEIKGWFAGEWWPDFWEQHFAFPKALPRGDVDVNGRWRDVARTVYFGRGDADAATLLGADFEHVHTLIFLRPNFTDGLALSADRDQGRQHVAGTFRRLTAPPTHETHRIEFDFTSNLAPEIYGRIAGGKADFLLNALHFNQPPALHAWGAIDGHWPGAVPNFSFTGLATGGLTAEGFPLDTARVAGGISGGDCRLDPIEFTVAGGKGTARASVVGPPASRQLGFDGNLDGADLGRTIRALEQYETNRSGKKGTSVTESSFMKRAAGARLDVSLSARGRPGDLASFTGNGNAALTGSELGEIHLFGLLSQALSGLSLNFSSLKLTAARSSFKLEKSRLYFPDLKVTGPSAVIDARGNYRFETNALDFNAKFKPFEDSRNPLTAVFGIVINPITSFLELKLNGPLNNPDWSIVVSSSLPKVEKSLPANAPPGPVEPPPAPAKTVPPQG